MYNLILPALCKTLSHEGETITISEAFENGETILNYDHARLTMNPTSIDVGEIALDDKNTNRLYGVRFKNGETCELLYSNHILLATGEWLPVSSMSENTAVKSVMYDKKSKYIQVSQQVVSQEPQIKRVDFLPTFLSVKHNEDGFLITTEPVNPQFSTILFIK